MKIAAGENQKNAPRGFVFVVCGHVDYEGMETLAVTTSIKLANLANLAIESDNAIRKAAGRWSFDRYSARKFLLDTAQYQTEFFTHTEVRPLRPL